MYIDKYNLGGESLWGGNALGTTEVLFIKLIQAKHIEEKFHSIFQSTSNP